MKHAALALTALILAMSANQALAQAAPTTTTSFNVKIEVQKACNFSATKPQDVDFGKIATVQTAQLQKQTDLQIACSKGTPYGIKLNPVNGNTNGLGDMTNGTQKIAYQLHQTSATGPVWGSQETNQKSGTGSGSTETVTVFATVEAAQVNEAIPGVYADTVDVLVTF